MKVHTHENQATSVITNCVQSTQKFIAHTLFASSALAFVTPVHAFPGVLADFNTFYGNTAGTRLDTCGVCHFNFDGGGAVNPYGQDWFDNGQNFVIISEPFFDSDGDLTENLVEINGETMPGYNCANWVEAVNAPTDLNTYVDPASPDCGVQPAPVDLDIAQFRVTKSVRIANVKPIGISLVVKNNGPNEGNATATITGIQNGTEVYREVQTVSDGVGNGRTTVDFLSYTPVVTGEILWTATITDDDPDDDTATATTNVR